jgi:Leucine-rich repeat (LRR) protein
MPGGEQDLPKRRWTQDDLAQLETDFHKGQLHADVYLSVARLFHKGDDGIPKDLKAAAQWYVRADDTAERHNGRLNVDDYLVMAELFEKGGEGFRPDLKKAEAWYRRGAEHHDQNALYQFALHLCSPAKKKKHIKEGAALLEKLAVDGHPKAQQTLGGMYPGGPGIAGFVKQRQDDLTHLILIEKTFQLEDLEDLAKMHFPALQCFSFARNKMYALGSLTLSSWFQGLFSLDLRGNFLSGSMPILFSALEFKKLEYLNLSKNKLSSWDVDFFLGADMPRLKSLWMAENQIANNANNRYFLEKAGCPNLEQCDLSDNNISDLAFLSRTPWKNLEVLHLGDNSGGSYDFSHLNGFKLRHLNLKGIFSEVITGEAASLSTLSLRGLEFLDLSNNMLDPDCAEVLAGIRFHGLRDLRLSRNSFGYEGLEYILFGINLERLHTLKIASNGISIPEDSLPIFYAPELINLDLKYNRLNADDLFRLLQSSMKKLTRFDVRNNRIIFEGVDKKNAHYRKIAQKNNWENLQYWEISENSLGPLLEFLSEMPLLRLRELYLDGNALRSPQIHALAHAPWINHLTCLDLSRNDIDNDGVMCLFRRLLTCLQYLFISDNDFGKEAGKFIFKYLPKNLKSLDISLNYVETYIIDLIKMFVKEVYFNGPHNK